MKNRDIKKIIVGLITEALDKELEDPDQEFELLRHQYYYVLEVEKSFMNELTLAPTVTCVGDLIEDFSFLQKQYENGVEDADDILECLGHFVRYLGARKYLELLENE